MEANNQMMIAPEMQLLNALKVICNISLISVMPTSSHVAYFQFLVLSSLHSTGFNGWSLGFISMAKTKISLK